MFNFSLIIILTFSISTVSSYLIYKYGEFFGMVDLPNERGSHNTSIPRGGGVGIVLSFILLNTLINKNYFLMKYISILGIISFIDDRYNIKAKYKFIAHLVINFMISINLYLFPTDLNEVLILIVITIFLTATSNFYNFMDGINGLAGIFGLISFGFITYFSFHYIHDLTIVKSSILVQISCLGFLIFNFPKAKVFMGDVGSIFLGFLFAYFVLLLSTSVNILICLIMFLSMFYADTIVSLYYRWIRGYNLLRAHRMHLYQYLTNELSIPHWKVAISYSFIQFLIGVLSILMFELGLIYQITFLLIFCITYIYVYIYVKSKKII